MAALRNIRQGVSVSLCTSLGFSWFGNFFFFVNLDVLKLPGFSLLLQLASLCSFMNPLEF